MNKDYEAPELKIVSFEVNEIVMAEEDPDLDVSILPSAPF